MIPVVVDASAAAKWFFREEDSDAALSLLTPRYQLTAPDLLPLELSSLVCKQARRKRITVPEATAIHEEIKRCPVRLVSSRVLMDDAHYMAVLSGASFYDCLYLALAVHLNAQVVTADRRFMNSMSGSSWRDYLLHVSSIPR